MIIKKDAIYQKTGFLINVKKDKRTNLLVMTFGDLNPEVSFKKAFTKWEAFKIGFWFIRHIFK